jgi:hypothetical protein
MAPDGSGHTPDGCTLREHLCARCHPRPPPRTRASGPSSRGRKSSRRLDATGSARARPGAHTAGGSVGNVSSLALASGSSKPRQAGRRRQLQRDDLQRSPCSARSAAIPAHGSACRLTFRERGLDLDHAIGVPATAGNRWSGGTCRASGPLERRLIPSSCPGPVEWSFSGPKPKKFHGEQFRAAPPRAGRCTSPAGAGPAGAPGHPSTLRAPRHVYARLPRNRLTTVAGRQVRQLSRKAAPSCDDSAWGAAWGAPGRGALERRTGTSTTLRPVRAADARLATGPRRPSRTSTSAGRRWPGPPRRGSGRMLCVERSERRMYLNKPPSRKNGPPSRGSGALAQPHACGAEQGRCEGAGSAN